MKPIHIICTLLLVGLTACGSRKAQQKSSELPPIFPDYRDVTVPANMAPLDFEIKDAKTLQAVFTGANGEALQVEGKRFIKIPINKWHKLLGQNKGGRLRVVVSAWTKEHPEGIEYRPFSIDVDNSEIEPYISYRLILLEHELMNQMGIYQRNLTNFEETAIVTNKQNGKGCVNCHTPNHENPEEFLFHSRSKNGGTVLYRNGSLEKIDFRKIGPQKMGVYPAWHPQGRFIAFTTNDARQVTYTGCENLIEVFDRSADLIIYDSQTRQVLSDERFNDSINMESFPTFSPDGKYLYFCTARKVNMPYEVANSRYSLVRAAFDEHTGQLGALDTVYSACQRGGSVSLPRISPDGRYVLLAWDSCGTFPIMHKEADLRLFDLQTKQEISQPLLNSSESESYHSWNAKGNWMLFSSRREDGRYTRLYFAAFRNGRFCKPFLLPQRDPEENTLRIYAYNVPEFLKGKIKLGKDQLAKLLTR